MTSIFLRPIPFLTALLFLAVGRHFAPDAQAAAKPAPIAGQAVVVKVVGKAIGMVDGKPVNLQEGMSLNEGALIQTAAESSVVLDLGANGRAVEVEPESELALATLTYTQTGIETVADTKLDLRKGGILGNVKKLSRSSRYEVQTPKGVAGIRGTSYRVLAVGIFFCMDGSITVVSFTDQGAFVVNGGNVFDINPENPNVQPIEGAQLQGLRDNALLILGLIAKSEVREGETPKQAFDRLFRDAVQGRNQNTTNSNNHDSRGTEEPPGLEQPNES